MKHLMLFGLTNLDLDTMQVIDPTARKRVMDSVSLIPSLSIQFSSE